MSSRGMIYGQKGLSSCLLYVAVAWGWSSMVVQLAGARGRLGFSFSTASEGFTTVLTRNKWRLIYKKKKSIYVFIPHYVRVHTLGYYNNNEQSISIKRRGVLEFSTVIYGVREITSRVDLGYAIILFSLVYYYFFFLFYFSSRTQWPATDLFRVVFRSARRE